MMEKEKHTFPGNISINDFNYTLPEDRIAKYPLDQRDASKLLVSKNSVLSDHCFTELPGLLPDNSLLIFNNTKVIRARLLFEKPTGARIEIFCLEPHQPHDYQIAFQQTTHCTWNCMIGNQKKWKEGTLSRKVMIGKTEIVFDAELISTDGKNNLVCFRWNNPDFTFSQIIENAGILPIPPYLNRATESSDLTRYQTVYSKIKGSVAAPTAGLHFTDEVFSGLKDHRHQTVELTLHVGAGTFQPVKSATMDGHEMHSEQLFISKELIEKLLKHQGSIIAVGTTTIRTLESIYWLGVQLCSGKERNLVDLHVSQWEPYQNVQEIEVTDSLQAILEFMKKNGTDHLSASTQIIIAPGYQFKMIDGMVTNFHQPQSTLLLLISAFLGDEWKKVYKHALANDYRFLSYGDSNLYLK